MKSDSENESNKGKIINPGGFIKQAEEFEAKLRAENISLYRELRLQNFKINAKRELSKNNEH